MESSKDLVFDINPLGTRAEATEMHEWKDLSEFIMHSSKKDKLYFSIVCIIISVLSAIYVFF